VSEADESHYSTVGVAHRTCCLECRTGSADKAGQVGTATEGTQARREATAESVPEV
jgi:hypothetical protein